ncbi:hypothetical protein HDV62DRAFT_274122 [Trichoderma sp. SZMC 28011]
MRFASPLLSGWFPFSFAETYRILYLIALETSKAGSSPTFIVSRFVLMLPKYHVKSLRAALKRLRKNDCVKRLRA